MNNNELELNAISTTLSQLEQIDENKRTEKEKQFIEYLKEKRKNILDTIL